MAHDSLTGAVRFLEEAKDQLEAQIRQTAESQELISKLIREYCGSAGEDFAISVRDAMIAEGVPRETAIPLAWAVLNQVQEVTKAAQVADQAMRTANGARHSLAWGRLDDLVAALSRVKPAVEDARARWKRVLL